MENLGLFVTIIATGMAVLLGMGGIVITLFLWNRNESNAARRDIVNLVIAIKEDIQAIQLEMKDFHGRLCSIEERRRNE